MNIFKIKNLYFSDLVTLIMLYSFWFVITGADFPNILFVLYAIFLPLAAFLLCKYLDILPKKNIYSYKFIYYVIWLYAQVIKSTIDVFRITWFGCKILNSQFISLDIDYSDRGNYVRNITYAISVTLTPGTATIALKDNKILIHVIDDSFLDDLMSGDLKSRIKSAVKTL